MIFWTCLGKYDNTETSAKETLVYFELKPPKPWFLKGNKPNESCFGMQA
jgi:hypothetical protein